MSVRRLQCENEECKGYNIKTLNPKLARERQAPTVELKARCNDCKYEFTFNTVTEWGVKHGIR